MKQSDLALVGDKNDFAILEKIGAECAGAVSLMRPDEMPATENSRYRKITLESAHVPRLRRGQRVRPHGRTGGRRRSGSLARARGELKYQQEGGPNLKKCFELVRAVSSVLGPDVSKLFDAVVFNVSVGNADAHGKNFSFLYDGNRAKLAPLYDLSAPRHITIFRQRWR